jgi:hypothetical protein
MLRTPSARGPASWSRAARLSANCQLRSPRRFSLSLFAYAVAAARPARPGNLYIETRRSISGYIWAYTDRHLAVLRGSEGDESH